MDACSEWIPSVSAVPGTAADPMRVTVLADSDTRWKWGALTARRIAAIALIGTGVVLVGWGQA